MECGSTYLECACEFFLSFREPREFVEIVESFRVSDCTPHRTIDNDFIPMLQKIINEKILCA